MKTLLDQVGLNPDAHDVMVEGLDDVHVKRPIPVSKALADDTLIALKMNGEPLPIDHGYPARLIVSGWAAVASIKWVGRIEVTTEASFSHWNTESYVLIGEDYPAEGEALGQIIRSQTVKSALELPEPAALVPGPQSITGRAWSPHGAIEKVEWRTGPDEPWSPARLVGENQPLAWCRFEFEWDATPGDHALEVRATDDHGNVQPDAVPWNELGYLYGAVAGHRVTVKT